MDAAISCLCFFWTSETTSRSPSVDLLCSVSAVLQWSGYVQVQCSAYSVCGFRVFSLDILMDATIACTDYLLCHTLPPRHSPLH